MPSQSDIQEIRKEARETFRTARVTPLRMTACLLTVTAALNLIGILAAQLPNTSVGVLSYTFSFFDILIMLIGGVLNAGFMLYCLRVRRGESVPYNSLFDAFPFAGKVVLLDVLFGTLVGLGLTLFIAPGVYLAFAYALAHLHLVDEPELGAIEALRRSRREMAGRKGQLFRLALSYWPLLLAEAAVYFVCRQFLGPALPDTLAGHLIYFAASSLLFACVELFLTPYLHLALAGFYDRVRGGAGAQNLNTL